MKRAIYSSSLLLPLALYSFQVSAAPGTDSAYVSDPQSTHVEDETSKGISQVNSIACILAGLRPDALVNAGNYNALVNETKCETANGADSTSGQAASYINATISSTRASNDDPMLAKIWIAEDSEDGTRAIDVHLSATEAPSTANPYGVFRLDFCGHPNDNNACFFHGFLEGTAGGVRFYQTETRDGGGGGGGGGGTSTRALHLTAADTTSGSGRIESTGDDGGGGAGAFNFAYNASLFRRSDGTLDQCFSRDANDASAGQSVFRYGLYDATTGARIERSSGFPIQYQSGGVTYRGYLGYYGLYLPSSAQNAITNGSTVQRVEYANGQAPAVTNFTVVKAGGKLTKYTKQTRTLHSIDKVKLGTFIGGNAEEFFAGATPGIYELYWDDAEGDFKVTGRSNCGPNGCQVVTLPDPVTVNVSYFQTHNDGNLNGFSQSLGGQVFIALQGAPVPVNSDNVQVIYRTQDLVYPSQMPATLYCLNNCPTNATLASYFAPMSSDASPFVSSTFEAFNPVEAGGVVQYHTDASSALLIDGADGAVTFTNGQAMQQHPEYQYGVRSGRLFPTLADAECSMGSSTYCDYKINNVEVYYQWETGSQNFNQFAGVKDSNDAFVTFDAPLQVSFEVPQEPRYHEFAGQSLVLQYNGFGELFGIPGFCVSRSTNQVVSCDTDNSRNVAAFVIPYDQVKGVVTDVNTHATYLVKWLDREIRFARKNLSVCANAGLDLPTDVTLPTAADLKDLSDPASDVYLGPKPALDEAPRVVDGDVKF